MKRTFRTCAIISGLMRGVHRRRKEPRQVLFSTDLIYDVLPQASGRSRAAARGARRCRGGLLDISD